MHSRAAAIAALEDRIGHAFEDRDLLERALTHASVGQGGLKVADNERLEFLGDRVLGLIIAKELMARDQAATAGALSKRFHGLVDMQACARIARLCGLGAALRLPAGETRRGARDSERILGDACEALIAAVFLEAGLERTTQIVLDLWEPLLGEPFDPDRANPKSQLQEWALAMGLPLPIYAVTGRAGAAHAPTFTVEVTVAGYDPTLGAGATIRAAERAAAATLIERQRGSP
jgi:ribonuclease-3